VDATTLKLAKNYTNEQVVQKATNSPVEEISFDGGIYSVGNNVVNGQVSDVVLKGNTYTNEVKESDFATLIYWTAVNATLAQANGVLSVTGNGSEKFFQVVQTLGRIDGTRHFISLKLRVTDSNCSKISVFYGGIEYVVQENPTANVWYTLTFYRSLVASGSPLTLVPRATYADAITANGKTLQIEQPLDVNLTKQNDAETNTTVLAQKYKYISTGTKSTLNARVKSVGKNLEPKQTLTSTDNFGTKFRVQPDKPIYWKFISTSDWRPLIKLWDINGNNINGTIANSEGLYYGNFGGALGSGYTTSNNKTGSATVKNITINANQNIGYIQVGYAAVTKSEQNIVSQINVPYELYVESISYISSHDGQPLRSLPNGVKDEYSATDGTKTQRVGVKENVASGTVINYVDMATDGQFVAYYAGGTSQTGVKGDTLTALAVTLTYQLATPIVTKLPAQAPLQVFENGTVYVEPIGDPAESTVPSVEMTIPTGTSNKFGVATHDYGGAAADWTLTNSESKCFLLAVSSAGGAANIIAPNRPGTMYAISNASGYAITIKKSGGAGVKVTNAKTVLVIHNGTDYTALTAEL